MSADFENGFAHRPEQVAENVSLAATTGLAGLSIEDWNPDEQLIYDLGLARDWVFAAAEAAHAGRIRLVLTAGAENHFRRVDDLDDTIARLQAYQAAGADVVFAPGITMVEQITQVVDAVDVPVSVLVYPGVPPIAELAEIGVALLGGKGFALTAYGALRRRARSCSTRARTDTGRSLPRRRSCGRRSTDGGFSSSLATTSRLVVQLPTGSRSAGARSNAHLGLPQAELRLSTRVRIPGSSG